MVKLIIFVLSFVVKDEFPIRHPVQVPPGIKNKLKDFSGERLTKNKLTGTS